MATAQQNLGYDDTPVIPGSIYKVHDGTRPQPRCITPGTASSQEIPGQVPSDAVVLFDGSERGRWLNLKTGEPAQWRITDGYMQVVPGTGNIRSQAEFGDCQLHVEWAAPSVVKGNGQGRGNSGIFMMGHYEIQVLDCYENPTYADGTTGAIYGQFPPLVNACRTPGMWQMFDIIWTAPRFDGATVISPAYATVLLNGVLLHNHIALQGPTKHRVTTQYEAHPETGPLVLQDHGDLVSFRNIWYRPLTDYDCP